MKSNKSKTISKLQLYKADITETAKIAMVGSPIHAGFPSPAEDYIDLSIDLNKELIKNPSSTFLAKVKGLSMKDAGIQENDILVVDKSLEPYNKCIAVCYIDGEFTLKKIKIERKCIYLIPANEDFKPIKVTEINDFQIWGIVTYVIKKV